MNERVRAVRPTFLPGRDEYEERIADKVKATGLPHCFICGRTIAACDEKSKELGFDECEWLAEKNQIHRPFKVIVNAVALLYDGDGSG